MAGRRGSREAGYSAGPSKSGSSISNASAIQVLAGCSRYQFTGAHKPRWEDHEATSVYLEKLEDMANYFKNSRLLVPHTDRTGSVESYNEVFDSDGNIVNEEFSALYEGENGYKEILTYATSMRIGPNPRPGSVVLKVPAGKR